MIHALALALYLAALALWLRALARGGDGRETAVAAWTAAAGVTVHFAALALYTARFDELPLVGLAPSLSTLALLVGVALVATLGLAEGGRVGVLLVPLIVALETTALVLGIRPTPGELDFRGAWFSLHVMLALGGVGATSLAAASGSLYLLQFKELKSRRLGKVFHFLPPLATLDRINRSGVAAGFTLLTLALAIGWAWTVRFRQTLAADDPKTLWAVLIWLAVGAALLARRGAGGERRAAAASALAFAFIVASYLAVRALSDGAGGGRLFL